MTPPVVCTEEVLILLPAKTRTFLLKVARRIVDGFEGEIRLSVNRGGGIRQLEWITRETGDSIKESIE